MEKITNKAKENNDKYLIFHVEGGLGKNVASTAVVTHLKMKYPERKIVVVCSYPEVYLNNENVYRVYRVGVTPYFFDNYINGKDTLVFRKEPYYENNHIMRKTSLFETWFNMYGIQYDRKNIKPYIPMNSMQKTHINEWKRQKPLLVIQTNGGPVAKDMQPHSFAWTRDMPAMVAHEIVKQAGSKYHIIQICRQNSYRLADHVERVDKNMSNFQLFALLLASSKRALIDSCLQHAAAAYSLSSTVIWVGTDPKMFGYDIHSNVSAQMPSGNVKLVDSYLFDFDFNGTYHEFPYFENDIIVDTKKVLNSLRL
jgi:hypothetical protein